MKSKGLSQIVTTIVLIGISLMAIGIIWYVLNNVINNQKKEIDSSSKCLGITLNIVSAEDCPAASTSCKLVIERGAGGGDIDGVKVVITDGTNDLIKKDSNPLDVLERKTITATGSPLTSNAVKATVSAIVDTNYICGAVDEYYY